MSAAIYLAAMLGSFHYNVGCPTAQCKPLNDFNPGVGIEVRKNDFAFGAGYYKNSYRRGSEYVLAGWQPLHAGPISAGIVGGAVTGYRDNETPTWGIGQAHISPLGGALVSAEWHGLGANIIVTPFVTSLQFKVRL